MAPFRAVAGATAISARAASGVVTRPAPTETVRSRAAKPGSVTAAHVSACDCCDLERAAVG